MGIYNRNGMLASLNESTRGFEPIEVCETFTVGDDLGWSCAKVCASIEEASNEWMREIGMEELEHATIFGEELIYEADDASAKKNKGKFMTFITSVAKAVAKFFRTIREKVAAFFAKFKKKSGNGNTTSVSQQVAMLDNIEIELKKKAAEAIADEEAPMFSKTIMEVDNYLNIVSTNKIKEEVVDKFIDDLEILHDEIVAGGNRDKRKFKNDDVNDATKKEGSKFMEKYKEFDEKWISSKSRARSDVAIMLLSTKDEQDRCLYIIHNDERVKEVLTGIYTGNGEKKKIGNIIDNAPGTPWHIDSIIATIEATEKNVESQLNDAMNKLQTQFTELLTSFKTRSEKFSETNLIATVKEHINIISNTYMAAATAFTEAAMSYIGYNKTLWNKYMVALEKVKTESKDSDSDTEKKSTNEGYNFFGAFESIR